MPADPPDPLGADLCIGHRICVNCCLCDECGRKVGTPHLDACACPPDGEHWLCLGCRTKRTAFILTRGASEPPDGWRSTVNA